MNLIMLTKQYPYGTDEAFIENEIEILASHFEKVIIFACEVPRKETRVRELPRNVVAYAIEAKSKRIHALCGLRHLVFPSAEMRDELNRCDTVLKKLFLGYFEKKSQYVLKRIKKILGCPTEEYVLYSYWLFMTARVGTMLAKSYKPAYMISRAHGYDVYSYSNRLDYLPYREYFLREYDGVFPCSNHGTEYLRKCVPESADRIQTAYLGTRDSGVIPESQSDSFTIVSCSRVSLEKRIWKIPDALKLVDDSGVSLEWIHIGGGEDLPKLQRYSEKTLGKNTRIKTRFYGQVSNETVMSIYKECVPDLFLNVSSREGLPVSIMEAMSLSVPVVATAVGGTSEIVKDNISGKLIPRDFSNADLMGVIQKFVDMKKQGVSDAYRRACRDTWKESFYAEDNYRSFWSNVCARIGS